MSQSVPPPSGNPFAGGPGVEPTAPYPAQPAAPARSNVTLGIVVGVVAMVVGALVYGGIMRAFGKENGEYTEIGYAALGVGALVGFAVGKVGGANPLLPVISAPLALAGVFAGQLFGFALLISWWSGGELSAVTILTENLGDLIDGWKEEADVMTWLFLAIGGITAFSAAKKSAR
ncbi:hypothetical protein [Streptomyces sp. NPDC047928]|uniref:hypothetical protein n=1 Tax=unclassified Streptomyces TaxID=2593676 RepID=UPI0037131BC5